MVDGRWSVTDYDGLTDSTQRLFFPFRFLFLAIDHGNYINGEVSTVKQ